MDNNIYISNENAGMVLTSPDGQCWKASINNNGTWTIEPGDCLTTSANETPDDVKQAGPVLIFPNPASDEIRIQKRQSGKYFATITNARGDLYTTIELWEKETSISLRDLPSGLVIVTIIDRLNRIVQTEKIVLR